MVKSVIAWFALVSICLAQSVMGPVGNGTYGRRYIPAGGAVDGHWVDPYDYGFLLDGQSSTNVNAAYGSVGSAMDNSAISGVANHNIVSNKPNVATGPLRVLGTNSLNDVITQWWFDGSDDAIEVNDSDNVGMTATVAGEAPTNDRSTTVYFWFNVTNYYSNARFPLTKTDEWYVSFDGDPGQWAARCYNGTGTGYRRYVWTTTSVTEFSNKWTFMTFVFGATNGTMAISTNIVCAYTNGIRMSYANIGDISGPYLGMTNSTSILTIGAATYQSGMAYVGMIQSNLSPSEVSVLYTNLGGAYGPTNAIRKKLPLDAYP